MIPKPPGEVGRPGRGGYNLDDALKWDSESLRKLKITFCIVISLDFPNPLQKYVHQLVKQHLDTQKTISNQTPQLLPIVCRAVSC